MEHVLLGKYLLQDYIFFLHFAWENQPYSDPNYCFFFEKFIYTSSVFCTKIVSFYIKHWCCDALLPWNRICSVLKNTFLELLPGTVSGNRYPEFVPQTTTRNRFLESLPEVDYWNHYPELVLGIATRNSWNLYLELVLRIATRNQFLKSLPGTAFRSRYPESVSGTGFQQKPSIFFGFGFLRNWIFIKTGTRLQ